jgi:hypothetical protein
MNNITPDYVDLETAKLLKEKKFKHYCRMSYWNNELTSHTPGYSLENGETSQENYYDFPRYYAPEISLVVKWLYLKHNIWIVVNVNIVNSWYFELYNLKDKRNAEIDTGDYRETMYNIPEQAYLEAIKYTLTKLI